MNDSKFSLNAFVLVVIIVAAFMFFFTVAVTGLAYHPAVNDFYPIEGTDLGVFYSSEKPNGIYKGGRITGTLKLEGDYGFDWGTALVGDTLYINEYTYTSLGMVISRVVRIDLNTFEKEVVLQDSVLRGRCASGELVCLSGTLLATDRPGENSLYRLYAASAPEIDPEGKTAQVVWLDPVTGAELQRIRVSDWGEDFDALYLQRSLGEVTP